uniref:LEM domain-containing protein n=1 Tax=Strongyloides papillosus TaxID=174720 RepID=A0A0N5BS17_STREA
MDPSRLSKEDLKNELASFGIVAPITQSTRPVLEKKLLKLRKERRPTIGNGKTNIVSTTHKSPPRKVIITERTPISKPIVTSNSSMNTSRTVPSSSPLLAREMGSKYQANTTRTNSKSPSRTTAPKSDILKQLEMLKEFSRNDPISIPREISTSSYRQPSESSFRSPNTSLLYQNQRGQKVSSLYEPEVRSRHTPGESMLHNRDLKSTQQTLSNRNNYPGSERRRFVDSAYGRDADKGYNRIKTTVSKYFRYLFWLIVSIITLIIILELDIDVNRQKDIIVTSCYNTFSFVFNYAVFPVFMIGLVVVLITSTFLGIKFYRNKKFKEAKQVADTAEKITGYLTSISSIKSVGVPEYELFDEIFPKMLRTKKDKRIFESALNYLLDTEINIRYEIHDYDGVETKVYFWTTPLRDKWQGSAVGTSNGVNLPRHGLANCLKVRGISLKNANGKNQEIMNDIRVRCIPYKILDMQIMTDTKDVVLYMKLRDNEEANKVFHLLHSHWFNGDLLNCKFLEETKYNQRFNV